MTAREPYPVVVMGLLGALCLVGGTLYLAPYQLPLPEFWEMRFTAPRMRGMLWASGVLLLVQAVILSTAHRCTPARVVDLQVRLAGREQAAIRLLRVIVPFLALVYAWLRVRNNVEIPHASLAELVGGHAWAPFQYRALTPWLLAGAERVGVLPGGDLLVGLAFVEVVSAFLLVLTMERLFRLYVSPTAAVLLAPLVFIPLVFTLATPFRANAYLYPYDTPAVLFMAAGLWLLLSRKWSAYYAVFALATLNRETTCFLTIMYVLGALGRQRTGVVAGHVFGQVTIWVAIKLLLVWMYPGIPIEDRGAVPFVEQPLFISMAERNVAFLSNPLSYPYLVAALAATWVGLIVYGRVIEQYEVRRALLVAVPFAVAMSYVGLLAEIRIFCELVPLFTLGYVLMILALGRRSMRGAAAANVANAVPRPTGKPIAACA